MKQAVVMPVLEPTTRLLELVDGLRDQGFSRFVVVDDGSAEGSAPVFAELEKTQGVTVLLVEQNAKMALAIADRAYVLETGRITLQGTGAELANDPRVQKAYLGG